MKYYGELYGRAGARTFFDTGKTGKDWEVMEQERNDLRKAIKKAVADFDDVRWGYDGHCGSQDIIEELESAIEDKRVNDPKE